MKVTFETKKSFLLSNCPEDSQNFDLESLTIDGLLIRPLPQKIDNLIVTKCNGDSINCWHLENVSTISKNSDLVIHCNKITPAHGVFSIVDFMYPDAKNLLDLAQKFDGDVYWHDNSPLLTLDRGENNILDSNCNCFCFITGYN